MMNISYLVKTFIISAYLIMISEEVYSQEQRGLKKEIAFSSAHFKMVGDLNLPQGEGPFPVILFVHGDGPNSRTSYGTYIPIMERMLNAGYATFAWDKPGTRESTGDFTNGQVLNERTQIVLDAIEIMKKHKSIDPEKIGLWGISQGGYVLPMVLEKSKDVAFMICVSCPGEPGYEQSSYLLKAQAMCEGVPEKDADLIEYNAGKAQAAQTYAKYKKHQAKVAAFPVFKKLGFNMDVQSETEWEPENLDGEYFFDPIPIIEKSRIPTLVFFGEKDTQADPKQGMNAYKSALKKAGNKNYLVELVPGVDHNLIISENGSIKERNKRTREGWLNYSNQYLDKLEQWLIELKSSK